MDIENINALHDSCIDNPLNILCNEFFVAKCTDKSISCSVTAFKMMSHTFANSFLQTENMNADIDKQSNLRVFTFNFSSKTIYNINILFMTDFSILDHILKNSLSDHKELFFALQFFDVNIDCGKYLGILSKIVNTVFYNYLIVYTHKDACLTNQITFVTVETIMEIVNGKVPPLSIVKEYTQFLTDEQNFRNCLRNFIDICLYTNVVPPEHLQLKYYARWFVFTYLYNVNKAVAISYLKRKIFNTSELDNFETVKLSNIMLHIKKLGTIIDETSLIYRVAERHRDKVYNDKSIIQKIVNNIA